MYQYVTSCPTTDGKIWNFAPSTLPTENIYACEPDTAGCKINSTQYIPTIDNICVDYRTQTFKQTVTGSDITYVDPYIKTDQKTDAQYW